MDMSRMDKVIAVRGKSFLSFLAPRNRLTLHPLATIHLDRRR